MWRIKQSLNESRTICFFLATLLLCSTKQMDGNLTLKPSTCPSAYIGGRSTSSTKTRALHILKASDSSISQKIYPSICVFAERFHIYSYDTMSIFYTMFLIFTQRMNFTSPKTLKFWIYIAPIKTLDEYTLKYPKEIFRSVKTAFHEPIYNRR